MLIIGIDPGKEGGIAWMGSTDESPLAAKMPETANELANLLRDITADADRVKCYCEKVASTPQMGVVSAFTFGKGFGRIEAAIAALNIAVEYVSPQKWQGFLACRTGGDKKISKAKAFQLFPKTKWTNATADAALIAEYGRRTEVLVPTAKTA